MKKMIILLLSILGIVVAAVAFDKAVEKEEKAIQQQWYSTDASGQDIGVMLTTPPPNTGGEACDQQNTGAYCAKLLEFDAGVDPEELEGQSISDIEANITDVEEKGAARHRP